jgi:hypothetical protein
MKQPWQAPYTVEARPLSCEPHFRRCFFIRLMGGPGERAQQHWSNPRRREEVACRCSEYIFIQLRIRWIQSTWSIVASDVRVLLAESHVTTFVQLPINARIASWNATALPPNYVEFLRHC